MQLPKEQVEPMDTSVINTGAIGAIMTPTMSIESVGNTHTSHAHKSHPRTSLSQPTVLHSDQGTSQVAHQSDDDSAAQIAGQVEQAVQALQNSVILIDNQDRITWWNPAAAAMFALHDTDRGKRIFEFIKAPAFYDYYHDPAAYDEGLQVASLRDPSRYLKYEITSVAGDKLLMIYDVTRLHHLEQMRQDFVANVSHELRTPLTVLIGYLENFSSQDDLPPRWKHGLEQMTQQTARMNRIVQDLLLLSKIEIEEAHEMRYIDMTQLLTHVYDDAQAYNQKYGHTLHLQIDTYEGLYGSEMYLNSALSNLVVNAIKYTPKGGNIAISWTRTPEGCEFAVEDDGIGIEPEHLIRLTERFYRVDSGRSRATGGTGLGLSIVKHVLNQYDTKLRIESKPNVGSTFRALFPNAYVCKKP